MQSEQQSGNILNMQQSKVAGLITCSKSARIRSKILDEMKADCDFEEYLKNERFADDNMKHMREFKGKKAYKVRRKNGKNQGLATMNWEAIRVGR